jgi:hypothetical protein
LELYLSGCIDPVAEWRVNDILLTPRSGFVTPKVYAKKTVIRREGDSAELGWETRNTDATIKYEASLKGFYLWTMPQVGSYQLKIECKVRDRTLSSREPSSTRLATREISVQGDSQLWDEKP